MGLLFDKYVPQEWLNSIFSDIKNCDIEIRPSKEWFNSPLFYLKKRSWLTTKKKNMIDSSSSSIPFTNIWLSYLPVKNNIWYSGISVSSKEKLFLSWVKKHSSSTWTLCHILNESWDILKTAVFVWDVAKINYVIEANKKYKIVLSSDSWTWYTSVPSSPISFPKEVDAGGSILSIESGVSWWNPVVCWYDSDPHSGNISHTNKWFWPNGIIYKAKSDIYVSWIGRYDILWGATRARIMVRKKGDNQRTPASEYYNYPLSGPQEIGTAITIDKPVFIREWDIFSVENSISDDSDYMGYWSVISTSDYSSTIDKSLVEDIWSVRWWIRSYRTPTWVFWDDADSRYDISNIIVSPAIVDSDKQIFDILWLAIIDEDDPDASLWERDTVGNIIDWKNFDDKLYMYTDRWYLYSFDWSVLSLINTKPKSISHLVDGSNISIWYSWSQYYMTRIGSTFSSDVECVLNNIKIRAKSEWTLWDNYFMRCYVVDGLQQENILAKAEEVIGWSKLTNEYKDLVFSFNNTVIEKDKNYLFYVEVSFSWGDVWKIRISWKDTNDYEWHKTVAYGKTPMSGNPQWHDFTGVLGGMVGFGVQMTLPLDIDRASYDDGIITLDYLGWWVYPSGESEFEVSSYDANNWTVTFKETTLNSTFLWKYAYIKVWSDTSRFQRMAVTEVPANNRIKVAWWFKIAPVAGNKIVFYNKMEEQLWIPQFRKWTSDDDKKYVFVYTKWWHTDRRFLPDKRTAVVWDNSIIQLTKDWRACIVSSNIDYEIPWLNMIQFWNSRAISLTAYGWYLMVFFENKVGIVKKDIINQEKWEYNYTYQDLVDVWLYSRDSYLVSWGNLYIFWNDKRLYSVDLSTISLWEIIGKLEDQGDTLVNYFDKFSGWSVRMYSQSWTLYVVYRWENDTQVFKYYWAFKAWLQDEYQFAWNFFNFLYNVKQDKYVCQWNTIYKMEWITDDWYNIVQRIRLYWPVQGMFDLFSLTMCKLRLWLSNEWIGGRVEVTVWWYNPYIKSWDISKLPIVKEINMSIAEDDSIGSNIIGNELFSWEPIELKSLLKKYSEILDISLKVGKRWSYFAVDIINDTDKQLVIGWIVVYYNSDNPLSTYNKWVLS